MKIVKIPSHSRKKRDPAQLLLFFAGWGIDERPFLEYFRPARDVMVCYDYSSLDFDAGMLAPYSGIKVVAWSMGVWAAATVLRNVAASIDECVAVNGTPYPVDDARGIPHDIFDGTLAGLNKETLRKFHRRMCRSGEAFERFSAKAPLRSLEDVRFELRAIGTAAAIPASRFPWGKIIVGSRDRIFEPKNQLRAWRGNEVVVVNEAHYPEGLWPQLLST